MLPSTFIKLNREEKAFIVASIDLRIENEENEMKKIRSK